MNPDFIQKLTKIVEANLTDENFGPEQLTELIGISHSTLHRRIKRATGKTISKFIRDVRLEKACELLLSEESTISEIAYNVGFGSVSYFNRCFHERFNCSPGEYKKQEQQKSDDDETKKKKRKNRILFIAVSTILVLILVFNFYNKFPFLDSNNEIEKSVAVMPFTFSGENREKEYMCKSMEDNIKSSLSKIGNLIIVNVFPSNIESRVKIGKHVAYFLDGTVHQQGNKSIFAVKLTNAKNNRLEWTESYDLTNQVIFSIESEVAQTVAQKLHATVSEQEKLLIEKKPTLNPEANDFYQMGKAAHMEYWLDNSNQEALQKAENYYRKAQNHDSTFALAYVGLARIAYDRRRGSDVLKENSLDTALSLTNTALHFDNKLSDAYTLLGDCFSEKDSEKAVKEYQSALKYDPNNWQAYYGLVNYYLLKDNIQFIKYLLEAAKRYRGPEYGMMLKGLAFGLTIYGLFEDAEHFNKIKLEWDNDTVEYYTRLAAIEQYQEHFDKAIDYALKGYEIDSSDFNINGILGFNFIMLHKYKNALLHYEKALQISPLINNKRVNEYHRMGYVYWVNGDTLKANEYFNRQIEASKKLLKSSQDQSSFYDLAATYAILNQKDKAFEYLRTFKKSDEISWFFYVLMKDDPLFQNIKNEAQFQQILDVVKAKATTTRDKLKTWFDQQEDIEL